MVVTSAFLSYWSATVVPDLVAAVVVMPQLLIGLHLLVTFAKKAVDAS